MELPNRTFGYLRVLMWASAAALLSLPAIAMQFFPQAGFNWTLSDFVVMGVLFAVAGGLVEVGMRLARGSLAYLAGTVFAVGTGFVTIWVNLAVGMILSENNIENLVFLGVILVALVGAFVARFEARGLAKVSTIAAVLQGLIGLTVLLAALDQPRVGMLIAGFALPWLVSAACFRKAADEHAGLARA